MRVPSGENATALTGTSSVRVVRRVALPVSQMRVMPSADAVAMRVPSGGERDRADGDVFGQGGAEGGAAGIPDARGACRGCGGDEGAVGGERDRGHHRAMAAQNPHNPVIPGIGEYQQVARSVGKQRSPSGQKATQRAMPAYGPTMTSAGSRRRPPRRPVPERSRGLPSPGSRCGPTCCRSGWRRAANPGHHDPGQVCTGRVAGRADVVQSHAAQVRAAQVHAEKVAASCR